MISACATHPGLVRQNNEDCIHTDDNLGIYLLADGIGGHNAGEVASALAVETVYRVLCSNIEHTTVDGYGELMVHAIQMAHWEIQAKAQTSASFARMGTTLVVVMLREDKAYIAHAGDSRCYVFQSKATPTVASSGAREGSRLLRLTCDHTVGDQQLTSGLAMEQIPKGTFHVLTRSVGCGTPPYPDFNIVEFGRDDVFLICSDGLTDMLADPEIEAILANGDATLDALVSELVDAANTNGGRDNISVVLVALP